MGNPNAFENWLKKAAKEKHMTNRSLAIAIGINKKKHV